MIIQVECCLSLPIDWRNQCSSYWILHICMCSFLNNFLINFISFEFCGARFISFTISNNVPEKLFYRTWFFHLKFLAYVCYFYITITNNMIRDIIIIIIIIKLSNVNTHTYILKHTHIRSFSGLHSGFYCRIVFFFCLQPFEYVSVNIIQNVCAKKHGT